MLYRKLIENLREWKTKTNRKPLILRGARQVGKTTLIQNFAKEFDVFIFLNLDKQSDRLIFEKNDEVQKIIQILFLRHNISHQGKQSILLFIDEIQNSSQAIQKLRYFYEELSYIHVIAAGSLLETLLNEKISFPVGRVEYMLLQPFCFEEFLVAKNQSTLIDVYYETRFPEYAHEQMLKLFAEYTLIGGMPEIVQTYLYTNDILQLNSIYDTLITTYLEDVEKYAGNSKQKHIIRHIIQNIFILAGERIKFEGFAASNYKSKDVGECFRILEKTFLLSLVYPTTNTKIPFILNKRKSPKLHVLDTGIVNKFSGLQIELLNNKYIDQVYEGKIAEHIVGQELLALHKSVLYKNTFWVKEKKQSNAELDYLLSYNNLLIPIEVKAGKTGRLRSLMEYMDLCPHSYAIRIFSGMLSIDEIKTLKGKRFKLLNLPFYLIGKIYDYIQILVNNENV